MDQMNLNEQLLFFDVLIENCPNLVIFKDQSGNYLKVNNSVSRIYGLEKEKIYGKSDDQLITLSPHLNDFLKHSIKQDEICMKDREVLIEFVSLQDPKGQMYYFKIRRIPVFSLQGDAKGIVIFGRDITEATKNKNYLELKNKFLSQAEYVAKIGSWYWEVGSQYVEVSDEFRDLLYLEKKIKISINNFLELFPEQEKLLLKKKVEDLSRGMPFYRWERIFKKRKRYFKHIVTSFEGKNKPYLVGIIQDMTEKRFMSYKIQLCDMLCKKANEGIVITDKDANIIEVNPAFTKITGYSKEEVVGQNPRILKSDRHPKEFYEKMWENILAKGFWEGEIWNRRKSGEVYPEILRIQAVKNEKNKITNFISIFYDLTKQKKIEGEQFFYRFFDPLTGLMNREYFLSKIKGKIESKNNLKFSVILIDIDNFKQINEAFSYNIGDEILKKKSDILVEIVGKNNVARIGEDTFALIFEFNKFLEIEQLIKKIKDKMNNLVLKDTKIDVTSSFGISIYPDDSKDPKDLLRYAETALNSARGFGTNNHFYFNKEILHRSINRLKTVEKIKEAVHKQRFVPFYQPKIDVKTGKILGLEALARWIAIDGEVIPPVKFIELAEETGIIIEISKSMANQIASHLQELTKSFPTLKIPCAINLSVLCLQHIDWVKHFMELSSIYNIPIELFQVEITETMLMKNEKLLSEVLKKLAKRGILICMDDFGTGYSSLYYLDTLPIDLVKIDKSFISPLKKGSKEKEIVKAIIDMCSALNIDVCAEGVETREQLTILRELGCAQVQGYYFSKPVPFYELLKIIKKFK